MKATIRRLLGLAVAVASLQAADLHAQFTPTRWVGNGVANDWLDGDNWSNFAQPDPAFDVLVYIGSDTGVPGVPDSITVTVTADLSSDISPGVTLGDGGGYSGTLNLDSSARLVTATGAAAPSADFNAGINGGVGVLNVSGNAQLTVDGQLASSFTSGGGSTISLQDNAVVAAASAVFERNLRVAGPSVAFSTTGDVTFGQFGVHEWEFATSGGSAGASVLSVGGELSLDGTLKIDTRGGTPSVGDSFVIADSASVVGNFSAVDTSDVPGLGLGVSFRAQSAASGSSTNGVLTSVVVEQQPVLVVNRQTGLVTLRNPGTTASVDFDTYAVGSGLGALTPSKWTSFAPADGWQQGNPSETSLSELNPLSSDSLNGGETVSLGKVFEPNDANFGENTEDIAFRFAATSGGFVNGTVIYEGVPTDTLTLNVDRNTGEAQIINGFRDDVAIDTYDILSLSGSLNISPSGWESLGGNWQIGVNEPTRVSELNPLESLTLANGDSAGLGELFDFENAGADEDFRFRFVRSDESFFRTGKVVFTDSLVELLAGDYNLDGTVDAADYSVWRDGDSPYDGQEGYDIWAGNYGASLPASASSVPEPASLACLLLGLVPAACRRRA